MKVKFKKIRKSATLPSYLTKGAAGADMFADVPGMGFNIAPGQTRAVPTGLIVELPEGYELQIRSRSGLAGRGVVVANSPGTIDADYRGEVKILIYNGSGAQFHVNQGDRLAQMVLARTMRIEWVPTEDLSATERGEKGFGSSGIASALNEALDDTPMRKA